MNENELELIELLLTAEIILLAKQIKAEKASKGTHTTSDCVQDAIREIKNKRESIISTLKK